MKNATEINAANKISNKNIGYYHSVSLKTIIDIHFHIYDIDWTAHLKVMVPNNVWK